MKTILERLVKIWKGYSVGEKIQCLIGLVMFTVVPVAMVIVEFGSFANFFSFIKNVLILVAFIAVCALYIHIKNGVHYTKPHRYIVQDEINKNYKVEKGWGTTTYVPKNKR